MTVTGEHDDGTIPITCPTAGVLTLDEIYERIQLDPPRKLRRVRERAAATR